jgi:hypothetical protein
VLRPNGPSSSDAVAALLAPAQSRFRIRSRSAPGSFCAVPTAQPIAFHEPGITNRRLKCLDTSLMSSVKALLTGVHGQDFARFEYAKAHAATIAWELARAATTMWAVLFSSPMNRGRNGAACWYTLGTVSGNQQRLVLAPLDLSQHIAPRPSSGQAARKVFLVLVMPRAVV